MKTQKRDGILGSHPYSDIQYNYDNTVVRSTRLTHFIAKVLIFVSV
jgi:hypothetical protein